jgi:hypothetical protein
MRPILSLPLWVIAPLLAILLGLAHELGVRIRRLVLRRERARTPSAGARDGGEYLRAALMLLSLLIGFTFGASVERYNMRRNLVEQEAAAIGRYYRNLLTVEEPGRTQLTDGLLQYLGTREAYAQVPDDRAFARATVISEAAGRRLWLDTVSVFRKEAAANARPTLDEADEMLQAAMARRNAMAARVPLAIICTVVLYALIVAAFLGYATRRGERLVAAPAFTFILLALAIGLILELDGARSGAIVVSQKPLTDLIQNIRYFEAQRRTAPPASWLATKP